MRLASLSLIFAVLAVAALPSCAIHAAESGKPPTLTVLERTAEPVLKSDRPWEDFCIGWCQVMKIDDTWHLWYDAYDRNYRTDNDSYSCYARSKDGIHWQKPMLGIHSYKGRKENNILGFGTHGVTVFLDEHAPRTERFKAVGVRQHAGCEWWVYGGTSADGVHWKWRDEPLLKKNADTANVCIRDGNLYRLYLRMWTGPAAFTGQRIIGYTESTRFGGFRDPTAVLATDKNDPANAQFYNSAATRFPDGRYLMLPSALLCDGTLSVYAAMSRDGKQFERVGRTPLLKSGQGFDSKGMYVGPGVVPGEQSGTYWFYYTGVSTPHDANLPQKVRREGGVGRFLLRVAD